MYYISTDSTDFKSTKLKLHTKEEAWKEAVEIARVFFVRVFVLNEYDQVEGSVFMDHYIHLV